jgi:hypothetical protein
MPVAIEHHVEWVAECIGYMREHGFGCIEPREEAENEWVEHTEEAVEETLMTEADSWYLGANVPGKPRTILPYPGGLDVYREKCVEVRENGYEGFELVEGGRELVASDD